MGKKALSLEPRASILLLCRQRFAMPKKTFARCGGPFLQYLPEILPRCLSLSSYPAVPARLSVSYAGVSEMGLYRGCTCMKVIPTLVYSLPFLPSLARIFMWCIAEDYRFGSSVWLLAPRGCLRCELLDRWNTSMSFTGWEGSRIWPSSGKGGGDLILALGTSDLWLSCHLPDLRTCFI